MADLGEIAESLNIKLNQRDTRHKNGGQKRRAWLMNAEETPATQTQPEPKPEVKTSPQPQAVPAEKPAPKIEPGWEIFVWPQTK